MLEETYQSLKRRYDNIKQETISVLKGIVSEEPISLNISTTDPFGEIEPVNIIGLYYNGFECDEYEELIPLEEWDLSLLLFALKEIIRNIEK